MPLLWLARHQAPARLQKIHTPDHSLAGLRLAQEDQ
jgi:hypothetical protein